MFPNIKILYVGQIWRAILTMSYYDPKSTFIKKYRVSDFHRTFDRTHSPASCRDILVWISKSPFTFTFPERFHVFFGSVAQNLLFFCIFVKSNTFTSIARSSSGWVILTWKFFQWKVHILSYIFHIYDVFISLTNQNL